MTLFRTTNTIGGTTTVRAIRKYSKSKYGLLLASALKDKQPPEGEDYYDEEWQPTD